MEAKSLKYLETYSSPSTVTTYRSCLKHFFDSIYGERDLALADRYISEGRDHEKDLETYFIFVKDRPPKSVNLCLSVLRTFYEENSIVLNPRSWTKYRRRKKGNGALTDEKVSTQEELQQIMTHMDARGKAVYLTLVSTGMRIGEVRKLKMGDIDLDKNPIEVRVRIENTKSGARRVTFASQEAGLALREWFKIRDNYIRSARNKGKDALASRGLTAKDRPTHDDRVFPFGDSTTRMLWNNALKKAGLDSRDDNTQIRKRHPHTLRKYFRSQMATVVPVDVVEAWMGHAGYLTDAYRRYTEQQLADFYKQGEHTVTIFGNVNMTEIQKQLDMANQDLRKVSLIAVQNEELRQKVENLEETVLGMSSIVDNLNDKIEEMDKYTRMLEDFYGEYEVENPKLSYKDIPKE